jgi:hypothetical protein
MQVAVDLLRSKSIANIGYCVKDIAFPVRPVSSEKIMLEEPIPQLALLRPMSICFSINTDQLPSEIVCVGTTAHCQLSKDIYPFLENSRSGTNSEMALISRDDSLLNIICSISGLQIDRSTISASSIGLKRLDVFLAMNGMPPIVLVEEKWGDADLPIAIQDIDRELCTIPHYSSKLLFIVATAIAGDLVCFGKLYLGGKFEHLQTFNLRLGLRERVYCRHKCWPMGSIRA